MTPRGKTPLTPKIFTILAEIRITLRKRGITENDSFFSEYLSYTWGIDVNKLIFLFERMKERDQSGSGKGDKITGKDQKK